MWTAFVAFLMILVGVVQSRSLPKNNSSVLISEYAKVAHWGTARSSQGQKPWTHRSEGSISYGQNLKNYRPYDTSRVPAVGEVQERFNPKPFFVYGASEKQPIDVISNESTGSSKNYDSPVYLPTAPPTEVLPVPMLPTTEPKPHEDPYNSPYSSYNPPPKKPEAEDNYDNSQSQLDETNDGASFEDGHQETKDSYHPDVDIPKPQDMKSNTFDDSYFPTPDDSHNHGFNEVILDHPPPGYGGKGEDVVHADHKDHFPLYLYDEDSHHDHHLYHEVEKPKEQKRVSKPQYSYYYIGRKLWYIPLYFSVYFIIYVTFLILKSIARHKIHFKHDLEDLHSRESRQLSPLIDANNLEDIHSNITNALENGKRNFPLVVM